MERADRPRLEHRGRSLRSVQHHDRVRRPARAVLDRPSDSPAIGFGDKEWDEFSLQSFAWRLSQFLHGEQGALLCTAKIVETVPWIDAKYYAATQVVDEARHVEVFNKYIDEKVGVSYPIKPHLRLLLDDIISDSRWDMTYLGMQIMVEGLALAAFGFMHQLTDGAAAQEAAPLCHERRGPPRRLRRAQPAGGLRGDDDAEVRERQEFAFEAAVRMRDRFLQQEVWDRMGCDVRKATQASLDIPDELKIFQQLLFAKIVPNCKKLGLLDAADGWLRDRFTEIGVIQFENEIDTGEEYELLSI